MRSIDRAYQQARAKNAPFPWELGSYDILGVKSFEPTVESESIGDMLVCVKSMKSLGIEWATWGCGSKGTTAQKKSVTRLLESGDAYWHKRTFSWVWATTIWWLATPTKT